MVAETVGKEERGVKTCSQKRREARRMQDPHGMQPFQRRFLGPTPVSSQSAASVAHAIAEDVKIEKATAIGVADREGRLAMARRSQDSTARPATPSVVDKDGHPSLPLQLVTPPSQDAFRSQPSQSKRRVPSPLRTPYSNKYSPHADRRGERRRPSREASFASAKSMPDSVLSEGDLQERREGRSEDQRKRGMRRDASAMAYLHHPEDVSNTTVPIKGKEFRRRESQSSSFVPEQSLGRKKLSFEVINARERRGRSEGSPQSGFGRRKERGETSSGRESSAPTALPLLDLPVSEEETPPSSERPEGSVLLPPLRLSASHQSMDQRIEGVHSSPVRPSDPPTDGDASGDLESKESARLQRMKDRARKRYVQNSMGRTPSTSMQTARQVHARDPSRQSRMSRASTAGTFASIGTRFSDGSFGATGGVRSKLVRKFGGGTSKSMEMRARDIQLERQRRGERGDGGGDSRGVTAGAIGTSAGGTKWVGQSFEVGKRFWEMVESREEELEGDTIDEETLEGERLDGGQSREGDLPRQSHNKRQASLDNSPDDVIDTFARQAQDANDEQESGGGRLTADTLGNRQLPTTPALTFTGSDSDQSRKEPQTPPKQASALAASLGKQEQRRLKMAPSQASLISSPHHRGADHESTFDIESRHGWSDVMSFMSTQSGAKNESRSSKETSNMARKALDGGLALDGVRTRQVERRTKEQEEERSSLIRSAIREGDTGEGDMRETREAPNNKRRPLETMATDTVQAKRESTAASLFLNGEMAPNADSLSPPGAKAMASILQGASVDSWNQPKKSVQFQGGANGDANPGLGRAFGTSFFSRNSPTNEVDGLTLGSDRAKQTSAGDAAPAPPEEVLSRNDTLDGLAFPASVQGKTEQMLTRRSVLKRDRMLVRLAWSPSEDLPKEFNERESRRYPVYSDPFREFMVVYRSGRLELWEDPSFVSKCLGHGNQLKLHISATLKPGRAFVSMYSPIDRIFCLTFTKDEDSSHRLLNLRRSGTCIWIFDPRSMTVGADWMWELCRELGSSIPNFLDVHLPSLSVRVRIPIPEEMPSNDHAGKEATSYLEGGEGYKLISRDYVKRVVRDVIGTQPEWQELCCQAEASGLQFELAWRNESTLDWIKEDVTADGQKRDWAVLSGSLFSEYKRPSVLEYRAATHYPTTVRTLQGGVLHEPPGLEGFLWRVKAVSGALTRLYVTTQDGLIFINRPSKAFPPDRHLAMPASDSASPAINRQSRIVTNAGNDEVEVERRRKRDTMLRRKRSGVRDESLADLRKQVLFAITSVAQTEGEIDGQIQAFRAFEKRRLFEQVNSSDGYVDVRDILLIKSLDDKGPVRRPSGDDRHNDRNKAGRALNGDTRAAHREGEEERDQEEEEEEEEDIGGEEGLALAKDRVQMKRNRQFEVVLSNGRSVRFEAYSKLVAREWVERLAEVARYWKRREKVDALELMSASGLDPALIGKRFHEQKVGREMESEQVSTVLGGIWNWCLYHSCRGILKSGRLFQKKKAFSGFTSRYYILIAGRLLHYKLMTSTRTARSRQNSGIFHKRQETVVHLRDAYVYSGKLTEDMLVNGRSEGAGAISSFGRGTGGASSASNRHTLPRVYGDGLMSVDDDEDCTFVIRYRPQRVNQAANPIVPVAQSNNGAWEQSTTPASPSSIPTLGDGTFNQLVLRARSKLERDLWVRAINIECERLNRDDCLREEKIRDQGQTPWKSHH